MTGSGKRSDLGPEYCGLPEAVAKDIAQQGGGLSEIRVLPTFVPDLVKGIVADYREKDVSYEYKVKNKVLAMENFPRRNATPGKKKRINPAPLSSKKKKETGLYKLEKDSSRYDYFLRVHDLWLDYIDELIKGDKNESSIVQKILRADFHGSIMTVIRAKCFSLVGLTGIVLKETKNLFHIIHEDNRIRAVPKAPCHFRLGLRSGSVIIYGEHIRERPHERLVKKLKRKYHSEIPAFADAS